MKKFLSGMNLVERWIAVACFAVIAVLMMFDIVSRELFSHGFPWSQKWALHAMVWSGFLGAALTSAKGEHLRLSVADRWWKNPTLAASMTRVREFLTAIFSIFCAWIAAEYVSSTLEFGDVDVVSGVPVWIVQIIIPYVFVSMGIRHTLYGVNLDLRPEPEMGAA